MSFHPEMSHALTTFVFRIRRQALVTLSGLLYIIVKDSYIRNFHAEENVYSRGCLGLTRVLGPAPGVRFLLPPTNGSRKTSAYVFFFNTGATVEHLRNI